jgi:hypothetical protein
MQTIILIGSCLGALTTIVVTCVKVIKVAIKINKRAEENDKHIKENFLDIKRLVITSPYMPLEERIAAGDTYIKQGGNGAVKRLYNTLLEELHFEGE